MLFKKGSIYQRIELPNDYIFILDFYSVYNDMTILYFDNGMSFGLSTTFVDKTFKLISDIFQRDYIDV